MKRFLTIDWDYFFNCSAKYRCFHFPDGGNENLPSNTQELIWNSHYSTDPELCKVGLINDYNYLISYLKSVPKKGPGDFKNVESHKYAYPFILFATLPDEEFEVVNVDFHHDFYALARSEDEVNCGNWALKLKEVRPNMKFTWVARKDSQLESLLFDRPPVDTIIYDNLHPVLCKGEFDKIFMCRSDVWSPPHLDSYYENLVREATTSEDLINSLPQRVWIPNDSIKTIIENLKGE